MFGFVYIQHQFCNILYSWAYDMASEYQLYSFNKFYYKVNGSTLGDVSVFITNSGHLYYTRTVHERYCIPLKANTRHSTHLCTAMKDSVVQTTMWTIYFHRCGMLSVDVCTQCCP